MAGLCYFSLNPSKKRCVQRFWRSWKFGLAVLAVQDFCQQKKLQRRQWWTCSWKVKKEHPRPALVILKEQQVSCHFVFHCKVFLLMVQVLWQRRNGAMHHWLCNVSTKHQAHTAKSLNGSSEPEVENEDVAIDGESNVWETRKLQLVFYDGCFTWRLLYLTLFLSDFRKNCLHRCPWFYDMKKRCLGDKGRQASETAGLQCPGLLSSLSVCLPVCLSFL